MAGNNRSCCAPKCRKVDDLEMVSCDRCRRWWHFSCAKFDPSQYDTVTPWFCGQSDCAAPAEGSGDGNDLQQNIESATPPPPEPNDLEGTLDQLIEAAVVAQASVVQKNEELAELRKEMESLKLKLADVPAPAQAHAEDSKQCSPVKHVVKLSQERLELLRTIQANHNLLWKESQREVAGEQVPATSEPLQSTPMAGVSNRRASFPEPSMHQSDMSSLLTILNRNNIQELPSFSGANRREWPYFEEVFKSTSLEGKFSSKENVARLRKALKGEAYQLVSDRLKYSSDDTAIMDSLRSIFGRSDVLVHGLTADLLRLPPLKSSCDSNLHMWAVRVNGFVADIKAMKKEDDLNNGYVLTDLACKLSSGLYQDWRRREASIASASLEDFAAFLTEKVIDLPPDLVKSVESSDSRKQNAPSKSFRQVLTHQPVKTTVMGSQGSCIKCGKLQHALVQCDDFKALLPDQRLSFARDNRICFTCLSPVQHDWRLCSKKQICTLDGCSGRHHQLLHPASSFRGVGELRGSAASSESQPNFVSSHARADLPVMYKVAPIRIYGHNQRFVDTFAFLDDGSCLTLMEKDLFNELNLEGTSEDLTVQWTRGITWHENAIRTNLSVSGVNSRKQHFLKGVYAVEELSLPRQSCDAERLKTLYPHLRGLPLRDFVSAKPRILIGLDQVKFLLGHGQRHGNEAEPCALKTLLGWIVYGPSAPSVAACSPHEVAKPSIRLLFHEAVKKEDELHELVKRHFSTEEFGVMPPKGDLISKDVSRALVLMERTLKFKDNRYEIGLLWDSDNVSLPDSYSMALNRLVGLERTLKKKPGLLEWKNNYMAQLVAKGYARIASAEELEKKWPRIWYAPTFIVHNPNKVPPKPRVVADVAATVNGVSLNSHLLKGPDNIVPLHAGLFKFREREIAVNADVKEMFHQIRIKEEDQQCQRILWMNGESWREPTVYIFEVMMFGPRCSPTCSQFVKNHHANLFRNECPDAVDGLTQRTYVDDYFNSHDTIDQALSVTQDAIRICNSMSFSLVGVQSNSREFLLRVPEGHVNVKLVSVDPSESEAFVAKILGMFWHPSWDHFLYVLSDDGQLDNMLKPDFNLTKREILRTIMRIFDPLGLISLYIIRGRIILQEVWREGFTWNQPVSLELRRQWLDFIKGIKGVENLKIPRRYVSWSPDEGRISLIVFVDASEQAFAAAAYLRFERSGAVEVALAMGKAKVAPVKKLSMPRLELQAAVLGVRVSSTVKSGHTIPIHDVIFLSDSKTVLAWINTSKFKFPSFVAVRIAEILESSSPRQWFYIRSQDNVADDGTRWEDTPMDNQEVRWFRGPDFLKLPFVDWPILPSKADESLEADGNSEPRILFHGREERANFDIFEKLLPRFRARWASAVRVIAFLLRFKRIFQKKWGSKKLRQSAGEVDKEMFVTPLEYRQGEDWLFRKIQQDAFHKELPLLRSKRQVASSSSIFNLSPFVDEEGTIRMSSRAQKALISYAARNPAILPKSHPLVDVFVQHHHDRNQHVGTALIISDIRERAWIISIRSVVLRIKSRCNMCKRLNAKAAMPLMGELPEGRLAFDCKPFTHVGVDCFGPLLVKYGRGTVKRYGMLFTCLTFRAVQIELLNDLGLDQCMMALRRFLINRVVTRYLYSDNGLNFVGTRNLLDKDVKKMEAALSDYSAKYEGILWRFIPAYSPWMGGAWERLIQSIKVSIDFVLRGVVPREDVLRNALIEAQGQINRRPLTHIPVDPEDPRPLTPNSILFGEEDKDVTAPGVFCENDAYSRLYSRRSQHLMAQLTRRWYTEYLPEITRRTKWHKNSPPVEVGSVVILIEPNEIRSVWQLGRISNVYPGPDGVIRTADVCLASGVIRNKRSIGRLAVLDVESSPGC